MPNARVMHRTLQHLAACGVREEILGDLLEEMSHGRSRIWLSRQVLALCRQTVLRRVRQRMATPHAIVCVLGALGAIAVSLVPIGRLIQVWLVVYYLSGMVSLFAHMAAADAPATGGDGEGPP